MKGKKRKKRVEIKKKIETVKKKKSRGEKNIKLVHKRKRGDQLRICKRCIGT